MFNRRKLLIFVLIAIGLGLASCSNREDADEQTAEIPVAAAAAPGEKDVLVASIPDKGIYLYGQNPETGAEGVDLRVGDKVQSFDWVYMTPRQIAPVMSVNDYDGDGEDELAIILNVGSGTGYSVFELHMLKIAETPLRDHVFLHPEKLAEKAVELTISGDPSQPAGELRIGQTAYPIAFNSYDQQEYGQISDQPVLGNIVHFAEASGRMEATFGVGIAYANFASPAFIGELTADVIYEADGSFSLTNYAYRNGFQ